MTNKNIYPYIMTSTSYVYDLTGQGSVDKLHFIFIIAFFVRGKTKKKQNIIYLLILPLNIKIMQF